MLKISLELIENLNNSGIRYVHWKGSNHFEDGFNGNGDVDLLVHEDDRESLHRIFAKLGFLNPDTQKYSQRDFIEDWIGMDRQTGTLVHIHLHFKVVFGDSFLNQFTFKYYNLSFDNFVERNGCRLQNPSLEMLILMCRVYTKSLTEKEKIKKNLDYLKQLADKKSFSDMCSLCGIDAEKADILFDTITDSGFNFKGAESIVGSLYETNIKNASAELLKRKIQYAIYKRRKKKSFSRFVKKAFKNGGIKIAFLGQDGAGKTTVATEITEWFRFKLEARNFYLGSGDNYFSIQKSIMKKLPKKKNGIIKIFSAVLTVSNLKQNARYTYKTIKNAEKYCRRGGVAVFDRYPQTRFAGINDGAKIRENCIKKADNPVLKKLLLPFAVTEERYLKKAEAISPDVVIKLMLSPEESMRRKPQENYEAVKRKHEIVKVLEFPDSQVYTVDVTQSYDNEIIEIKNIIWENLLKNENVN